MMPQVVAEAGVGVVSAVWTSIACSSNRTSLSYRARNHDKPHNPHAPVENRVPPLSLSRHAVLAAGQHRSQVWRRRSGCQRRARNGWSGRWPPSVAAEPRQVMSRFAASTADPDSSGPAPCRIYRRADDAPHSPARPRAQQVLTPMPRTPELHFGRHCVALQRGRCATRPAVCVPGHDRGLRRGRPPRKVTSARPISFDSNRHCGRTMQRRAQPARPAAHPTRPF